MSGSTTGDILSGAAKGAATGATIGSAIPVIGTGIGAALGLFAGGTAGYLSRRRDESTPTQKKQQELVDQLLGSLKGDGPFSDIFASNGYNKDAFKSKFFNQIAPQIQQSYVASGQQRGTGLEDTLTRAGVDLNQLLEQQQFGRQESAINSILGAPAGARPEQSGSQAFTQGVIGTASNKEFRDDIGDILKSFNKKKEEEPDNKGFTTGV